MHQATIDRDAYPSPLNYRNFPKSVCTSVNEVICHGIPDKRKLQEGDIINIGEPPWLYGPHPILTCQSDVSLYKDGQHPLNRVVHGLLPLTYFQ